MQTVSNIPRLLIVEDDYEFREIVERRFRRRGLEVFGCEAPSEAIDAVRAKPFQAAIIDGRLQGRSGIKLIESLQEIDTELCIIVLSGCDDEASIKRAKHAGAKEYLCKPCSLTELEAAVGRYSQICVAT